MKIAFLTPEYPHPQMGKSGGIGTSIYGLAEAMRGLGHRVSVLVYGQQKDAYFEEGGIHFYTIRNVKVKGLSLILTQKKVERLINLLYGEGKIDLIEAPDWTGFTSFVKPKCPVVIRENGSDTYFCHLEQRPQKYKNKYLERRALKQADGVISVSDYTGTLTNALMGLNKTFAVIPNSIDVSRFKPEPGQEQQATILYFGTLIRKKGLFELVAIFNKIHERNPEVRLVLAGHDSADAKTGAPSTWALLQPLLAPSALDQVQYLGPVAHQDIQHLIVEATVCVFPSFAEALPVSWLEAMAMEKAIVASNIGWAEEMITDGKEGYLVHPREYDLYAERIIDLLKDPDKRKAFGKAARQKVVEVFNNTEVAKRSIDFYKQFVN